MCQLYNRVLFARIVFVLCCAAAGFFLVLALAGVSPLEIPRLLDPPAATWTWAECGANYRGGLAELQADRRAGRITFQDERIGITALHALATHCYEESP